jgi:protein SCO1
MNTKRLMLAALAALGGAAAVQIVPGLAGNKPPQSEQEWYWPDSILQTHEGKEVRFYTDLIKHKVVIINAMYTVCTGICPTNTARLLELQKALGDRIGKDIFIYSISLRPDMDSPAALKEYADRYGVKPGWTFLTGKTSDIEVIRRKLGFYDSDPIADANLSNHSGVFRIGNDLRNRWFMTPAATPTRQVVASVLNVI